MKLNIAICDDEQEQIAYLQKILQTWLGRTRHIAKILTFSSAEAFLFEYSENQNFDILLLDIEMSGMSGVDLARKIRETNHTVQLVFVTGYYEYFSDGFDVSALHYLIKPTTAEKLYPVLDRAVANLQYRERSVLVSTAEGDIKVPLSDIKYLESDRMYLNVCTVDGVFRARMALAAIANLLDDTFYKIHRSYIVNLKYVRKVTRTAVTVEGGTELPLSRGMYDGMHAALIKYL